jgi:hypothetical protein
MTPGVYAWSWGSGADADTFTIDIAASVFGASGLPVGDNSILAAELPLPTEFTFPLTMPAPEPSTWAMMLVGFAGLGYAALRRKGAINRKLLHPPLTAIVAFQAFYRVAEATACRRGADPDQPSHLEKVTETL